MHRVDDVKEGPSRPRSITQEPQVTCPGTRVGAERGGDGKEGEVLEQPAGRP